MMPVFSYKGWAHTGLWPKRKALARAPLTDEEQKRVLELTETIAIAEKELEALIGEWYLAGIGGPKCPFNNINVQRIHPERIKKMTAERKLKLAPWKLSWRLGEKKMQVQQWDRAGGR